jgi:limonene-1,2-epoxide hydrolase
MTPKQLVLQWVAAFNRGNADELAQFYSDNAVNHQVAERPVEGRENIRQMFEREFFHAEMTCLVEQVFEDGDWAILEWKDPLGLRGCGFFHIHNDQIIFQRGYWDKLSFLRQHNLPLPTR